MRAAIIGGGLAGLTCAYKLGQRGIDSVVFDDSPRAGGRSTAETVEGFTLDIGAQYLLGPEIFRLTFELIRELGLSGDLIPIKQTVGQFYRGKVYYHQVASATGLLHFKGLSLFDKVLLPRMALILARCGPHLDVHDPGKGAVYDDVSVAEFVRRELSQNILNYVAGPLISTLFFYGSEETSRLLYLLLAKYMYSTGIYSLRGGIGRLTAKLSLNTATSQVRIAEISRSSEGFLVGQERFSHLVLAVPGNSVLQIRGLPELLDAGDRRFFEDCKYQRAVTVFVGSDTPVDGRCYGVSIPRVEKMAATTIAFHDFIDSSRTPSGHGLLAITGGGSQVSPEELLSDLARIYAVKPFFIRSVEWPAAMPKFPPGRFREIEAFRSRRRMSGLVFCGDYLMGPFLEAAVTTGMQAAESVGAGEGEFGGRTPEF